MRSGLFMAAEPVGAWRTALGRHAGVADEPAPMREGVGAGNAAFGQMSAHPGPRLRFRREASGETRDVEQDRLASFLDGETTEAGAIHMCRTEQLCGGAEVVELVGKFAQAERDADFFVADGRRILRQSGIKLALIVAGTPLDGSLQQPGGHAFVAATDLREPPEESGNVGNIAQPAGERWCERLFLQFHDEEGGRTPDVLNPIVQPGEFI